MLKKLIATMINEIINGRDYRTYVLATINERFLKNVEELTKDIFHHKKIGEDWVEKLLINTFEQKGEHNKRKLLWFGGLNQKTVRNMTGTTKKEVCLDLVIDNIKSFEVLLSEIEEPNPYKLSIRIKHGNESVELNETESLVFLNAVSAMKLTIQGGAWSEAGKMIEKSLMYTIFTLLEMNPNHYILPPDEMKEKGLVANREIDAIVFDKNENYYTIEVKLLGIGNPEIGDEALARGVDLFVTDRLTDMMITEAEKRKIKVIELRAGNSLTEIYDFFTSKEIQCSKPKQMTEKELKQEIEKIVKQWKYDDEEIKMMKKLKELTQ